MNGYVNSLPPLNVDTLGVEAVSTANSPLNRPAHRPKRHHTHHEIRRVCERQRMNEQSPNLNKRPSALLFANIVPFDPSTSSFLVRCLLILPPTTDLPVLDYMRPYLEMRIRLAICNGRDEGACRYADDETCRVNSVLPLLMMQYTPFALAISYEIYLL